MKTIKVIDEELKLIESMDQLNQYPYMNDSRIGVQKLIIKHSKRIRKKEHLIKKFNEMSFLENSLSEKYRFIAGIDEAGRGPIAGPVVAAAVILPKGFQLYGLNDSKQLSLKQRMEFRDYIKKNAIYGIGAATSSDIDQYNIYEATKYAMNEAINQLIQEPDYLLIDAVQLNHSIKSQSLIRGDEKSISIAAASVLAKTERDLIMNNFDQKYPEYEFYNHKGYGTKAHLDAIKAFGVTDIHRKSFEPVKSMIKHRDS